MLHEDTNRVQKKPCIQESDGHNNMHVEALANKAWADHKCASLYLAVLHDIHVVVRFRSASAPERLCLVCANSKSC
jgi:hypothetical protein